MNWQDIAVILVFGAAIILLAGRIFRRNSKSSSNACSSCSDTDCPLRDLKSRRNDCDKR